MPIRARPMGSPWKSQKTISPQRPTGTWYSPAAKQTLSCLLDQDDYGALLPRREKDGKKPEVHVRFRLLDLLRQADT